MKADVRRELEHIEYFARELTAQRKGARQARALDAARASGVLSTLVHLGLITPAEDGEWRDRLRPVLGDGMRLGRFTIEGGAPVKDEAESQARTAYSMCRDLSLVELAWVVHTAATEEAIIATLSADALDPVRVRRACKRGFAERASGKAVAGAMVSEQELSDSVWALLDAGRYAAARRLLKRELARDPDNHWLLTRIGMTYYEERKYSQALEYERRAFDLAPHCPLVIWDLAGTEQMLGHHEDAIRLYDRLIARGVERLAHGECGEGLALARGLTADSHLRRARSLAALGRKRAAANAMARHLGLRGPGCRSIYSRKEALAVRDALSA